VTSISLHFYASLNNRQEQNCSKNNLFVKGSVKGFPRLPDHPLFEGKKTGTRCPSNFSTTIISKENQSRKMMLEILNVRAVRQRDTAKPL